MTESKPCSWCASDAVFGPVHLYTVSGSSSGDVFAATAPTSGMFRQQSTVPVVVSVCRACGHLDLFATDPEALYARYSAGER